MITSKRLKYITEDFMYSGRVIIELFKKGFCTFLFKCCLCNNEIGHKTPLQNEYINQSLFITQLIYTYGLPKMEELIKL